MSDGLRDVTPRAAADRWLNKRSVDLTEKTVSSYWYRIKKVVDFCEARGIDSLAALDPWTLDEFDSEFRGRSPQKVTLSKEYRTINNWLAWAVSVGIAQQGIDSVLQPPATTKEEEVSTDRLDPEVASANLWRYRQGRVGHDRGTLRHVLLELEWWTGARIAAIRGLDRGDVDLEAGTIDFIDRRESGTGIKPAFNPERRVGLQEEVVAVLRDYVAHVRHSSVTDDAGREPFLTMPDGRISESTAQRFSYVASLPCVGAACPHEKDPATCAWTNPRESSKCPSSQGPHAIRTGAISNLLNSGWPPQAVAERVNTSPQTLARHYDFPSLEEQYRERRANLVERLTLDDESTQTTATHE